NVAMIQTPALQKSVMPRACPVVVHVRRYKSDTFFLAVGSVERNGPRDKPAAFASQKPVL
ncbi:MAG: hypothetical protein ACQESR_25890, partial [Planctomycetota bacterium]